MILVLETTKWESNTPNHHYLLDDNKSRVYGYIKRGTKEMTMMSKPFPFDKRYRTFKTIKKDLTFVG
jgi:hypothetical protein